MKTVLKIFLLLTMVVGLSPNITYAQNESAERGYIVKVGDVAPDFGTTLNNGKLFKLSEQKGKVVMIQFTASWCGVC